MHVRTVIVSTLFCGAVLVAAGLATCRRTAPPADPAPAVAMATQMPELGAHVGYDFDRPLRTFALPETLREISAVTTVDAGTVACLQDEKGMVFFVDVHDGRVVAAHAFGPDGDYEGLTRVGAEFFVLRSDGVLARVSRSRDGFATAETFQLTTPNRNLEGLCHDATRGLLLLAPKDFLKPDRAEPRAADERGARRRRATAEAGTESKPDRKALRDQRVLFGWDLTQRRLLDEPVLRLSVDDLREQAEARGDDLPTRTNRRGKERTVLRLLFSCVAVQPSSGDLYLLSAVDQLLLVVDRQGQLRQLHRLDPEVLPKPEGLTFLPGGDVVVTSEGVDGPARLVVYGGR